MRNSLYDSYKLSNTSVIPMYQGSAAPEMVKVVDHLRGQYDLAQQGANEIGDTVLNLSAFPGDEKAVAEVRNHVTGKIKELSEAKDWENQVEAVRGLGRFYVQRAKEIAAPAAQYAEFEKELDKDDKKLTADQKTALKADYLLQYRLNGGLKKDALGRYSTTFKPNEVAENIDQQEWLKNVFADRVVQSGGTERITDDGFLETKTGNTWTRMPKERIKQIVDLAVANSGKMQNYIKQETRLAGNKGYAIKTLEQLEALVGKPKAQEYTQKGYSPTEAAGLFHQSSKLEEILENMKSLSVSKYEQNDYKSSSSTALGTVAKGIRLHEATTDPSDTLRITGEGAATAPEWAQDPKKLTEEIAGVEKTIGDLETRKAVLERQRKANPTNTQVQLELERVSRDISDNKKLLANNSALWNKSREQAVLNAKISDGKGGLVGTYGQFLETTASRLEADIKGKIPNGITVGKKTYSPKEIAKAVAEGRYTESEELYGEAGTQRVAQLRMPDGTVIRSFGGKGLGEIIAPIRKIQGQVEQIEKGAHSIHRTASKNYSITPNMVGLTAKEQAALSSYGIANGTVYAQPGSNEVYRKDDVRDMKWVPGGYNPETGRYTGHFESQDGKTRTGLMDVKMSSTFEKYLLNDLKKTNSTGRHTPAIMGLEDRSYSGPLTQVRPGTVLTGAPDRNGLPTNKALYWDGEKVEMELEGSTWVLKKNGTIMTNEEGNSYQTSSITVADNWLRELTDPKQAPKVKK